VRQKKSSADLCLVPEDSATLKDRDLVRRQAGVQFRSGTPSPAPCRPPGLPHVLTERQLAPSPIDCRLQTADSLHQQLAPPALQQRFHNIQMPIRRTDHEAADSIERLFIVSITSSLKLSKVASIPSPSSASYTSSPNPSHLGRLLLAEIGVHVTHSLIPLWTLE
jgi:hypothetical protein